MKRPRKRKCLHCAEFYLPDPRTHDRRRFCSAPDCKRASKAWRQRRWLSKEENRDYFGDEKNTDRVRQWRQAHPGYWRRRQPKGETTAPMRWPAPSTTRWCFRPSVPSISPISSPSGSGALHLTRREDLLELDLPEPDLSIYHPEQDQPPEDSDDEQKHSHS